MLSVLAISYAQERHGAKTVSQLKQFVQKLPHMQQAKQSLSKREFSTLHPPPLVSLSLPDTTIAELVKGITDKDHFLEMIYAEQSKSCYCWEKVLELPVNMIQT